MDRRYFFDFLFPFQDDVLRRLAGIETGLYLTGGTAASLGYLQHRFSDDLDLFANDERDFRLWTERALAAVSSSADWRSEVLLREERFVRANLIRDEAA